MCYTRKEDRFQVGGVPFVAWKGLNKSITIRYSALFLLNHLLSIF